MAIITVDNVKLKQIPGFPNYFISKCGKVWSKPRYKVKGGWLKPQKLNQGHLQVGLGCNGKIIHQQIHRLVLTTHKGKCPAGMEACHRDGDPTNNQLNNLRWDTHKSNYLDMVRHGIASSPPVNRGELNNHNKLSEEQVKLIFHSYHDGIYNSRELAEYFNVDRTTISKIITKKNWSWLWL